MTEFSCKKIIGFVERAKTAQDQASADWFMRAAVREADKNGTTVEAVLAANEAPKVRCPHYAAIKEFFAVAKEKGLDTAQKDRARGAVGMLLGKRIESRAALTGEEWTFATSALRMGKLIW